MKEATENINARASGGMLIRDMANEERPREKALRHGIKSLSTAELLAIIFSTGTSGKSVIQLSNEILADAKGHLSKVARMSVKQLLKTYKGIGQAKALTLLAALELGSRASADAMSIEQPRITSSEVAAKIMREEFDRLPHEEFWVLYLSQAGKEIRRECVSRGGLTGTVVDVKIIMRHALEASAVSMILFHNHPSGNLTPSVQDDNITRRVKEAAATLDLRINDHIIMTDGGYYSYNDQGRL